MNLMTRLSHFIEPARMPTCSNNCAITFLIVLLIFNPLYPLLLTTTHTIAADVIAVVLFV